MKMVKKIRAFLLKDRNRFRRTEELYTSSFF